MIWTSLISNPALHQLPEWFGQKFTGICQQLCSLPSDLDRQPRNHIIAFWVVLLHHHHHRVIQKPRVCGYVIQNKFIIYYLDIKYQPRPASHWFTKRAWRVVARSGCEPLSLCPVRISREKIDDGFFSVVVGTVWRLQTQNGRFVPLHYGLKRERVRLCDGYGQSQTPQNSPLTTVNWRE